MLLLLLACGGPEPAPYSDCDPLVPDHCALPWPSAQHIEGSESAGWTLDLGPETLPPRVDDGPVDPTAWNRRDGFSLHAPLIAWFDDLADTGLPTEGGESLEGDSPVVLVDLSTGERVPVRAELSVDDDPSLLIHPVAGLEYGRWYAVGLAGLVDSSGAPIQPSEAFLQLRDDTRTESWDVEGRREAYEERIFPALEAAGVPREDLQLAWHFRTASQEDTTAVPLLMRDLAAQSRAEVPPQWAFTDTRTYDCAQPATHIGLHIEGTMQVPMFLDSEEAPAFLVRDEEGLPVLQDRVPIPLELRVPCSVLDPDFAGEVLLVQYGHGLFQDREEIRKQYLGELADTRGWVLIATDWQGMSREDTVPIVGLLSDDYGGFGAVPERLLQSWVNQDTLLELARGALTEAPELQVDGAPLLDGERYGFLGISMGGVVGGGYLGWSEQLDSGVLNVPGTPFAMLLPRSTNFAAFAGILEAELEDPRSVQVALAAMQTLWDPAESAGWTPVLRERDTLLIQHNLGDAQVTTLAGQRLARAVGAELLEPATRPVWGLESSAAPQGSAYLEWDYVDISEEPTTAVPADADTDTHVCCRQEPLAWEQMDRFLRDGEIVQTCSGSCSGTREGFCDERPQ